jgi:hypothetical protein
VTVEVRRVPEAVGHLRVRAAFNSCHSPQPITPSPTAPRITEIHVITVRRNGFMPGWL